MLKLVAAAALAGAIAAAVFLVPIRGRTISDRWQAAPSPGRFASESWDEARRAVTGRSGPSVPPAAPLADGRGSRPRQQRADPSRGAARGPLPAEHHSAEDRAALDRLLSERSR